MIFTSCKDYNGDISDLQNQINNQTDEISGLIDDIDAINAEIETLVGKVQSIVVIPECSDGGIRATSLADTVSFHVTPESVAESLATNFKSLKTEDLQKLVSFSLKTVTTRASDESAKPGVTVENVWFQDGKMKVTARFTNLPLHTMTSLHLKSVNSDVYSEYFVCKDITPKDYSDQNNWMICETNPTHEVDLFFIYPTNTTAIENLVCPVDDLMKKKVHTQPILQTGSVIPVTLTYMLHITARSDLMQSS